MLITFKVILRMILCFPFLLLPGGCGKGFEKNPKREEELLNGEFYASLRPLNRHYGTYQGWLSLNISENQFWTRVKVSGLRTTDMHPQYIHAASRCPGLSDDGNGDGFLDFMEVINVSGPIIIPLDTNLTTQQKGIFEFPRMRRHAFYYYSEATNFQWMMEDLRSEDVIQDDYITKLHPKSDLELDRRVLIVYGVDEDRYLPPSVRTLPGYPSQRTLPIACGEIRRGRSGASF